MIEPSDQERAELPETTFKYIHDLEENNDECRLKISKLIAEVERLSRRDGNALIRLLSPKEDDPFHRETLRVVDFGVADNIYIVEQLALFEQKG